MNNPSPAYQFGYQVGQIVGAAMVAIILIGGLVFFILAVVKAIKTGRKSWIIAASISGLPVLAVFGLFLYGIFLGITKASDRSHEIKAAKQGESSALLTAAMTSIPGRAAVPYAISLPWEGEWSKKSNVPYDYVFSYRDLYIGVIVEGIGLGTPQKACDFAQKNMQSKCAQCSFKEPVEIKIGDLNWLFYDATATTVSNVDIKYRVFLYADKGRTAQILCWTGPVLFDRYAPVMDRIAKSFRFTETK